MGAAGLSLTIALVLGMTAHAVGRWIGVPSIVLYLATGALAGPSALGWLDPAPLASSLPTILSFATAVILFEGGLGLDRRRLRHGSQAVRRLVIVGALLSAAGGALLSRALLHWPWPVCALFGAITCVTGPTVIAPLLDHIRVKPSVDSVLRAEGVLVDGIAALAAAVLLDLVVVASSATSPMGIPLRLAAGLGVGVVLGGASGGGLAFVLRRGGRVAHGSESAFALAWLIGTFALAEQLFHDAGLLTVTLAGATVGNLRPRAERDLREFKSQLGLVLLGTLFVLLAADASGGGVRALGWAPWLLAAALAAVVRPVSVLLSCLGTRLSLRERLFIAWMGPRGIVAAAVASLAATRLRAAGHDSGDDLRAVVFVVIVTTVTLQPLFARRVAAALNLLLEGPADGRLLHDPPKA